MLTAAVVVKKKRSVVRGREQRKEGSVRAAKDNIPAVTGEQQSRPVATNGQVERIIVGAAAGLALASKEVRSTCNACQTCSRPAASCIRPNRSPRLRQQTTGQPRRVRASGPSVARACSSALLNRFNERLL